MATTEPPTVEIPEALATAHERALASLVRPGATLTGADRRAVVEESRAAHGCAFCAERRDALAYAAVEGAHETATDLGAGIVELVHRGVTDPGRLTTAWARDVMADGVTPEVYVEVAALVGTATIVDTLATALGDGLPPLAPPEAGDPTGEFNPHVVDIGARVPVMDPQHPLPQWQGRGGHIANIARALGLVPPSLRQFWGCFAPHYMPQAAEDGGEIGRPQIEFVAARTSALNECFY